MGSKEVLFTTVASRFHSCQETAPKKFLYFLGGKAGSGKSTIAKTLGMYHSFLTQARQGHRTAPIADGQAPELASVRIADGDDYRSLNQNYQQVLSYAEETGCGTSFTKALSSVPGKRKTDFKSGIIDSILSGDEPKAVIAPTVWEGTSVTSRTTKMFFDYEDDRTLFRKYLSDPSVVAIKVKWDYTGWNDAHQTNDKFVDIVSEMALSRFKRTGKPPPAIGFMSWSGKHAEGGCTATSAAQCQCAKIVVPWSVDLAQIRG